MKTTRTFTAILFGIIMINISTLLAGCYMIGETGNGNVIKQTREVSTFNSISVSGAYDVILSQGTAQSVVIEADENLLPLIKTEVRGNELEIYNKHSIGHSHCMKVYVTVTDLRKIDLSGAVDLSTQTKLTTDELSIDESGASDTKMDIAVKKLNIDCSGGSKLRFSGSATQVRMDVSGAVDIFAYDLATESFHLEISGAGKAEINVSKELNASISGAGTVHYKGTPEKLLTDVSGAGSIRKAE
ncbi:MAG: DUF2807 domain-containing protein [Bacteroidetes bacterium]|nr:DUF2807 domain-containing protein [Bacteroidota bacterium]